MPISLVCSCGALLEFDDKFAGQTIHCPDCQKALLVPGPTPGSVRTSGLALASLVLALAGAFTVVGTLLAAGLGALALRAIGKRNGALTGRRLAVAGIVLGLAFTGLSVLSYSSLDILGIETMWRAAEWSGQLDYREPLTVKMPGFALIRPSARWGIYVDPQHDPNGRPTAQPAEFLLLVNVAEDAHLICFRLGRFTDVDNSRDEVLSRFRQSKLGAYLRGKLDQGMVEVAVRSAKALPVVEEMERREWVVDVRVGRRERVFLFRILRPTDRDIYVIAAGTRQQRFADLEAELKQMLDSFKLEKLGG